MNDSEEFMKILKDYENKSIVLKTVDNFRYNTSDLKILEDAKIVRFTDKYGQEFLISVSEILSISPIGGSNGK